jgi:hypothetical protein
MRWWNAVCTTLRKRGPMSLTLVTQTLANNLAAHPLSWAALASLRVRLRREVDLKGVIEIGGFRFSEF